MYQIEHHVVEITGIDQLSNRSFVHNLGTSIGDEGSQQGSTAVHYLTDSEVVPFDLDDMTWPEHRREYGDTMASYAARA